MSEIVRNIIDGNTIYSDNFKSDYLTGGWVVVDRDKMIQELQTEYKDLQHSLDSYKKRCELIQKYQSKMRDPERKIICDILANGVYHE